MAQIKNSIFNKKKLKYQIEKVNFNDISDFQNRLDLVKQWIKLTNSNSFYQSKETELQGKFLFDVFGKILGYSSKLDNPNEWNLNQEQVTTGGKFADGSLGFYSSGNEIIRVVIELKDANSNLDEKQHRHHDNRTPVEQAFDYQHKIGKDCKWVIVSNFNEIRLYHHSSSIEYEQFFIKDLGEEEKLKRFFFLLGKDNLIAKEGNSLIDSLFISNEQDEQEITKKFYAAFKDIRLKFFDHLKTNNPTIDENILLEKTQKLLDRFIFICFAEDNRLLPETIFKNMVKVAKHSFSYSETKVWTELKGLFNAINIGSTPHNINKFNGGLFAADEVLDSLQIKDQILEELSNITDYDFESDVSIDILGHIFEQSISDLEEIKASINGEVFEKSKSKRKRDGIVYTPAYITRDIVEKAVGGWLEDRKIELGYYDLPELSDEDYNSIINNRGKITYNDKIKQHLEFWYAYRERLMNIKVLDPACGSGAFLIQVFDFLYAEGNKVNDTIAKLLGGQYEVFQLDKHILSNNIYGVDINSESVEITKLSLWLKTANKNAELTSLDNNIKCGNSLIDDPEVAGDKAFDWNKEFAEIMNNGGFDVVVGNPPYVISQNLLNNEKQYFYDNYKSSIYQINLYLLFIERSLKLINKLGNVVLIVPNTWLINLTLKEFRQHLIENYQINFIIDLTKTSVFENIVVLPVIVQLQKSKKVENIRIYEFVENSIVQKGLLNLSSISSSNNYLINYQFNISYDQIIKKMDSFHKIKLGDIAQISFGVKFYQVNKGKPKQTKSIVENKIFTHLYKKNDHCRMMLEGKDVNRYNVAWNGFWIEYGDWLAEPRSENLFQDERILLRRIVNERFVASYVSENYCNNSLLHTIKLKKDINNNIVNTKALLSLLNSKLFSFYFIKKYSREEKTFPEIRVTELKDIGIPYFPSSIYKMLNEQVDTMLDKNKELQEKNSKFQELLKADFNIEKLNTKLENWYNLSWSDFELELKKLKITLSGERKEDWIERFNRYKSQANELQNIIQITDKKIDQLVYELYGLTEEEIKVVEGE